MVAKWSQALYTVAWEFATFAHHGQSYGSPIEGQRIDYISHIGSVAMEVIWALSVDDIAEPNLAIQCALLHDVIEDTQFTYQDIQIRFGTAVADGVLALSKNTAMTDKTAQMQDSLKRIKQQPFAVWMVKLADRITNLAEPPHYWSTEKRQFYRQEAQLILSELNACPSILVARLADKIETYQQYITPSTTHKP